VYSIGVECYMTIFSLMTLKDIPARIVGLHKLTKDSVEISMAFEEKQEFSYAPGQFIMLELENPRFESGWKPISPSDVWQYIQEHGGAERGELTTTFSILAEKTLDGYLKKLMSLGAIAEEGNTLLCTTDVDPALGAPPLKRAYSLGSTPTRPETLNTMVKEMPGGYMSRYLVHDLRVGDAVRISGPLGHFMLPPDDVAGDILLIGAGSGITPLMGMLRFAKDTGMKRHVHLIYSNKTPEDIIYKEELDSLENEENITITHTITRPDPAQPWAGRTGRVDKSFLVELALEAPTHHVYICGSMVFAKSMKELLLELGAKPEHIKLEAYG